MNKEDLNSTIKIFILWIHVEHYTQKLEITHYFQVTQINGIFIKKRTPMLAHKTNLKKASFGMTETECSHKEVRN